MKNNYSLGLIYGILVKLIVSKLCRSMPLSQNDIWGDRMSESKRNEIENSFNSTFNKNYVSRLPRVLNFFPVPVEEECKSNDGRRKGICMNPYECRIQSGASKGPCALGFGVCCVFTATCNQDVFNNITYFVNPNFPDLTNDVTECSLVVKKIDPEVSQLRLDFIHFNLGQPNRKTGVCEDDYFLLSSGEDKELRLCGVNSGQHAYYDIESVEESVTIRMKLSRIAVSRLWEVTITQIPFTQRAPIDCLQYHTGTQGVIQTMNFADNGRHLAEQDYNVCVRQEEGMCSIAYEPCHKDAFRIAPNNNSSQEDTLSLEEGSGGGDLGGQILQSGRRLDCNDRIVVPCDSEDLLMRDLDSIGPGICDVVHCGDTLCPQGEQPCRIETSAKPFTVGIHFGPSTAETQPDDNLGMCLLYQQLPCIE